MVDNVLKLTGFETGGGRSVAASNGGPVVDDETLKHGFNCPVNSYELG